MVLRPSISELRESVSALRVLLRLCFRRARKPGPLSSVEVAVSLSGSSVTGIGFDSVEGLGDSGGFFLMKLNMAERLPARCRSGLCYHFPYHLNRQGPYCQALQSFCKNHPDEEKQHQIGQQPAHHCG